MPRTNLIIESAQRIEVVKECGVGFSTPEIHICDLEVAPDFQPPINTMFESQIPKRIKGRTSNEHKLYVSPPFSVKNPNALSLTRYCGCRVMKSVIQS